MAGGIRKYVTGLRQTQTDLLWLVMTNDNTSWGDSLQGVHISRSIDDVHEIIHSQYDPLKVSLGLLTSSRTEYELYKLHPLNENYGRVTIYLHPGYHTGQAIDRKDRHDSSVQYQRRSMMAKLRNFLMLKTLHDEKHIVWLDADVWYLDPGIINRMIQHVTKDEDVGILTARTELGRIKGSNYDLNCWQGTREGPRKWDLTREELRNGELAEQGQSHLPDLLKGTEQDELIPLDAIGATLLYMRSTLVEQGLSFPHQYTVGTRWGKDGWDGIESEGLCYRARGLKGGLCMALGGTWHVAPYVNN